MLTSNAGQPHPDQRATENGFYTEERIRLASRRGKPAERPPESGEDASRSDTIGAVQAFEDGARPRYSVVIPVYNSAAIVGETIDRTLGVFVELGESCEVIAVNDGSTDESWQVIRDKALVRPNLIAINLLKNYGQHAAILCGFRHSRGDWVVTLDDDLQNPPEEIVQLIEAANRGHDVVCGRFRQKRHPAYRKLASKIVGRLDRHVFRKPQGLALTNFRILRRDVVDRIKTYPTPYPYIRGLMLICSTNPTDVWVDHHPRPGGGSSYSLGQLLTFVARIVFSYSTLPVRAVLAVGVALVGRQCVRCVVSTGPPAGDGRGRQAHSPGCWSPWGCSTG